MLWWCWKEEKILGTWLCSSNPRSPLLFKRWGHTGPPTHPVASLFGFLWPPEASPTVQSLLSEGQPPFFTVQSSPVSRRVTSLYSGALPSASRRRWGLFRTDHWLGSFLNEPDTVADTCPSILPGQLTENYSTYCLCTGFRTDIFCF